jgi:toxin CcdB
VVVQSSRFRSSARRVVVPLVAAEEFGLPDSDIGPHFTVAGRTVVLDPRQITHVPCDALGPSIDSHADQDTRVVNALDSLFSRAWR